jgi:hypothetical protein
MEYTRRVLTNVAKPTGTKAPMGQFARVRSYPKYKSPTALVWILGRIHCTGNITHVDGRNPTDLTGSEGNSIYR